MLGKRDPKSSKSWKNKEIPRRGAERAEELCRESASAASKSLLKTTTLRGEEKLILIGVPSSFAEATAR